METSARQAIVNSFDTRSNYFSAESAWSTDEALNNLCAEMLVGSLEAGDGVPAILDYGAGLGVMASYFVARGAAVDVADVSEKMLASCQIARHKYLLPRDQIHYRYDGVLLRQVLQYVPEQEWGQFILRLVSLLRGEGSLLVSQIVPVCRVDSEFLRHLISTRRPERCSFPTENEILPLCESLGLQIREFRESRTRHFLQSWIEKSPRILQEQVRNCFGACTSSIRALWDMDFREGGDIHWTHRWVHILIQIKMVGR